MKNTVIFTVTLLAVSIFTGCTNWEQKYKALEVEHENVAGRLENCMASLDGSSAERMRLSSALSTSQQTIEDLQRQIEGGAGTGDATGFGGLDVEFDPNKGTITITLPNSIVFTSGKASLRKSTISELDQVLSVIRER